MMTANPLIEAEGGRIQLISAYGDLRGVVACNAMSLYLQKLYIVPRI
jgi:hypothetical protein